MINSFNLGKERSLSSGASQTQDPAHPHHSSLSPTACEVGKDSKKLCQSQWYPGPDYCREAEMMPCKLVIKWPCPKICDCCFHSSHQPQNVLHISFSYGKLVSCNSKWVVVQSRLSLNQNVVRQGDCLFQELPATSHSTALLMYHMYD